MVISTMFVFHRLLPKINCSFFHQVYASTAADYSRGDDERGYKSNNTVIDSPSQVPSASPAPDAHEETQKGVAMELDEKFEKHLQDACSLHDQQNLQDTEMQPNGHEPQTTSICNEKTCPRLHIPKPIDQSNQPLQQKEHESLIHQRPCCSNAYDDLRKDKDIGKTDDKSMTSAKLMLKVIKRMFRNFMPNLIRYPLV